MYEPFAILMLGVGGTALGLLGLLRPRLAVSFAFTAGIFVMCASTAALALLSEHPAATMAPLGVGAIWFLGTGCRFRAVAARGFAALQRPAVTCSMLLVATPILAYAWAWSSARLPEDPPLTTDIALSHRAVLPSPYCTDSGRAVVVYVPTRSFTPDEAKSVAHQTRVANLICTAPPGAEYNCHGWTFTNGSYWVNGNDVELILADNAYQSVSQPRQGDLIVYRQGRNIVHTGIVRMTDDSGVLVESKWDRRGRYIHRPEHQDYASEFEYFRSDRVGHLLRGISEIPTPRAASVESVSPPGGLIDQIKCELESEE